MGSEDCPLLLQPGSQQFVDEHPVEFKFACTKVRRPAWT